MSAEDRQPIQPPPPEVDPLLAQAQKLPDWKKGTDGDPAQHVRDADGSDEPFQETYEDSLDDEFGGETGDPSQLTADD